MRRADGWVRAAVVLLGALAGCGRAAAPATTLPVLVLAADADAASPPISAALTTQPIDQVTLTAAVFPPRPTDVTLVTSPATALGTARQAYLDAQPEVCLAELATLDVRALLAAGQRDAAARLLVLRTACSRSQPPTSTPTNTIPMPLMACPPPVET